MTDCSRCEVLPTPRNVTGGTLYIAPPLAQIRSTLRRILQDAGITFEERSDGTLAVKLTPGDLQKLSDLFREGLSEGELKDSRVLLLKEGSQPALSDLMKTQDLATFTASVQGEWLLDILRKEKLVTYFQPIISVSSTPEVFAYECLLRGLDEKGGLVSPGRMFSTAKAAGLLFYLDRAARLRAIETSTEQGLDTEVFINFNPTSVYDPVYCLQSMVGAIDKSFSLTPERIVFEVTESEEIKDSRHLLNILNFYRESGFRVALDDLGAGYGSLNLMEKLRPDFVKLDIDLVRDVDTDSYKARIAAKLLELARDLGVRVVAEGVETEGQWRWLQDNGADYAQGFFFARPAFPPPVPANISQSTVRSRLF